MKQKTKEWQASRIVLCELRQAGYDISFNCSRSTIAVLLRAHIGLPVKQMSRKAALAYLVEYVDTLSPSRAKVLLGGYFLRKKGGKLCPSKKKKRNKRGQGGFYWSQPWRELRQKILLRDGLACVCCGEGKSPGKPLHVDHIIPRSIRPDLDMEPSNLQVLCYDCNLGKSAYHSTDFRGKDVERKAVKPKFFLVKKKSA